jgi:ubiquinone/menaquinone biosynthesis C-methylase UbiE
VLCAGQLPFSICNLGKGRIQCNGCILQGSGPPADFATEVTPVSNTESKAVLLSESAPRESSLSRFLSLQSILCCPITGGPLRLLGIENLASMLADGEVGRIPEGTVGAFISDQALRAYPLIGRVADFLERDSLGILGAARDSAEEETTPADEHFKWSVKDWYDRFGWKKTSQGLYNDTALFSQNWPEGHGLYEMMSHLSVLDRLPGGESVIDAASGALAHTEYFAYSWFYKRRVCVDLSLTALQEADTKLRERDVCCLADICRLPFREQAFEGAISGYTIQHIPASQQFAAMQELYRVIKPNTHLCILTDVEPGRGHHALFLFLRALRKFLKILRVAIPYAPPRAAEKVGQNSPPGLYGLLRDAAWWRKAAAELSPLSSIEVLRLLSKREFEYLFGRSNRAAKILRSIEDTFPKLVSGMATCCLIDICKPAPRT